MNKTDRPLRVLSFGAGVQSSTIAMMMKHGEIEPADVGIFADVKAEPKRVYQWLDWIETQLPFPLIRVTHRTGLTCGIEEGIANRSRIDNPPLFTKNIDGTVGIGKRQCTKAYKLAPIRKKVRELAAGRRVVQMIGISHDERQRAKPSDVKYITNEWPLLDKQMVRQECKNWMFSHWYPTPPRSACVYCPYKCDAEWRLLRDDDPEGWAEAVRMDKVMRRLPLMHNETYLHHSCVPLDEVDLSTDEDRGQMVMKFDCEGMCGV